MKPSLTYLKAILAMFFWSATFVWFKIAYQTYLPYEVTFLRLLLASILLFMVMLIGQKREKVQRNDFLQMMLVAFCEPFMYFIGEANGMRIVSSTLGSLVISTIPIISAVGAFFILKEKLPLCVVLGLIVSTAGVVVMSLGSSDLSATFKGILYLLIAVLAGVFYGISVRNLTLRYSPLTIVTWQNFFGMLYFLPLFLIVDGKHFFSIQHSAQGLVTIAAMSIFASVTAFILFTGVIRDLGVAKSNIFTNLIPVFTAILAFVILGDKLSLPGWIGLALAVLGLFLSQYPDWKKRKKEELSQITQITQI
ncbi:MAG: DMT family transporter [Candidatus Cloacimonas sp.]